MTQNLDMDRILGRLDKAAPGRMRGKVRALTGLVIRATVPGATVGEMVHLHTRQNTRIQAQVVGFREDEVLLMPLGDTEGLGPESAAVGTGKTLSLSCGPGLLGRVLDGLGQPIDGGEPLEGEGFTSWAVHREAPAPLARPRITKTFVTGIRAIDGLITLGQGQRVGLFAGSGVGKSRLLGQIAQANEADVSVICMVGERGREVLEFLEESLGDHRGRVIVVCATSDAPALVRCQAPFVATAIAEYFRDQGQQVLLLMDSVTRFARAQREVGLATGEPPVRRGFPPSVFRALPRLIERAGNSPEGSITALYTVLLTGEHMEDPIADELRGLLDGHIVLSRELAQRAHWPAIDALSSLSRVMRAVTDAEHQEAADACRRALASVHSRKDLVAMGAIRPGADESLDEAMDLMPEIHAFLQQGLQEHSTLEDTLDGLLDLFG